MMTLIPGIGCRMFVRKQDSLGYDERKYGLLYNWYAANDVRKISSSDDWHLPTYLNIRSMATVLDPDWTFATDTVAAELKETGFVYWNDSGDPSHYGTNSSGFNARGVGDRSTTGTFAGEKTIMRYWRSESNATSGFICAIQYNLSRLGIPFSGSTGTSINKKAGEVIRLVKDSTALTHGQTGTYNGNDGKVYRTICVGTQEWLADNLAETKYRNGDSIPEVTDATAWSALTTGALCAYNNDWINV